MADAERLSKVKKNLKEATRLGEDLLRTENDEEVKKMASSMGQKIGQVYEEIDRIGDPETQAQALTELETGIEKFGEIEKLVVKKKGFNPFKKKKL